MPDGFQHTDDGSGILEELFALVQDRKREMPEGSYTTKLLDEGVGRIAQKVIEEAGETAIAAAQGEADRLPEEAADLLYHLMVLLSATGVTPKQVWAQLRERRK